MYYELFGSDGDSDEAEAEPKLAPSPTASDGIVDEILKQAEAGDAEHQDSADDEEAASEAGKEEDDEEEGDDECLPRCVLCCLA